MQISFFGNPEKSEIQAYLPQWVRFLIAKKHPITLTKDLAAATDIGPENVTIVEREDALCINCDLLVSLGGDGTILWASQLVYDKNIPLLGVKFGGLGFLAEISPAEFQSAIDEISRGQWKSQKRLMLSGRSENSDLHSTSKTYTALNEFSIVSGHIGQVSRTDIWVDENHVCTYIADGVLISTPTGSTAYSLSARGPLLMPTANSMIIVPICPHTLTERPLVVDGNAKIRISSADKEQKQLFINADGRKIIRLSNADSFHIQRTRNKINLLHRGDRTFFDILRAKLNWGDDLRQSENGKG